MITLSSRSGKLTSSGAVNLSGCGCELTAATSQTDSSSDGWTANPPCSPLTSNWVSTWQSAMTTCAITRSPVISNGGGPVLAHGGASRTPLSCPTVASRSSLSHLMFPFSCKRGALVPLVRMKEPNHLPCGLLNVMPRAAPVPLNRLNKDQDFLSNGAVNFEEMNAASLLMGRNSDTSKADTFRLVNSELVVVDYGWLSPNKV